MVNISHVISLFKECWRGKSIYRSLHNLYLGELPSFNGRGIDFGAKNGTGSYYRFIDITNAEMTYTDFYSQNTEKVKSIDFENDFDLSDMEYDFALCMNTLEHVFNHQSFMNNIAKCLKDGGMIEGVVPFLLPYHADPDDYFRYTHSALLKILSEAGFNNISITKIGIGGFTVSANLISRLLKFKILVFILWIISIGLDVILNKIWKTNQNTYLGLAFSAKKSN